MQSHAGENLAPYKVKCECNWSVSPSPLDCRPHSTILPCLGSEWSAETGSETKPKGRPEPCYLPLQRWVCAQLRRVSRNQLEHTRQKLYIYRNKPIRILLDLGSSIHGDCDLGRKLSVLGHITITQHLDNKI